MGPLLGVDGGATKTVALIADLDGHVLGQGRDGSSDIHATSDPDEAIGRVAAAVRVAAGAAGVAIADLGSCAFSVCGADWPEDVELFRVRLREMLGMAVEPLVVNDAMGALRAGTADGIGAVLSMGTGGAVGASGPDGETWFSGMRLEPSGALEFGRHALELLIRGEYGGGPVPAFHDAALAEFGMDSVEGLLHLVTARGGLGDAGLGRLAVVLLDAGQAGDTATSAFIREHGSMLSAYIRVAARRVGLPSVGSTLVLAGGLLRHPGTDLLDGLRAGLPGFTLAHTTMEPALGAVLLAADEAGVGIDVERLRRSAPDTTFFATI